MQKKNKYIFVTQRLSKELKYFEERDSIDINLIKWIKYCGYVPIQVSNQINISQLKNMFNELKPKGIILSGGENIGQYKKRDHIEKNILIIAKNNNLPVLGICRGCQFLNYFEKGTIKKIKNHINVTHSVKIPDSKNYIKAKINSYHSYAIDRLSKKFIALSWSKDLSIELIKHISLPWEGWMWHPERNTKFTTWEKKRFKELFL